MRFLTLGLLALSVAAFGSDKKSPIPHADTLMMAFEASPLLSQLSLLQRGTGRDDAKKRELQDRYRLLVLNILGHAGSVESVPTLNELLKEKDLSPQLEKIAKISAMNLLRWTPGDRVSLLGFEAEPQKHDDALLQLLADTEQVVVRSITAEFLGKTGDPKWIPSLAKALDKETVPGVRFKIFQALAALDHQDARAILLKRLEDKKVSDQDKQYLEFFLAIKNHKAGNSKSMIDLLAATAPPAKTEEEKSTAPPAAPVTEVATTEEIKKVPLKGTSGKHIYMFRGEAYESLDAIQELVAKEHAAKTKQEFIGPKPIDIISLVDGKEVTEKGLCYDGKCFRTQEALLAYLLKQPKAPVAPIPAPEKKSEAPKLAPAKDEYERFAGPKTKVGEFHSRQGGYLTFGLYTRAGLRGPFGLAPHSVQPYKRFNDEGAATKVCFDVEALKKLIGTIEEKSLPVTESTAVAQDSMKIDGKNVCYNLVDYRRDAFGDEGLKQAAKDAADLFKDIRGIETLPKETQAKLRALWASKKEVYDRVEAVAGFWRSEVKYLLDDYDLYAKYFSENRDSNLLQAAVALKKGRCVPKNFGLGVAIYQLSEGKVPVRFAHVLWLEDVAVAPIAITLDRGHLHTQYLLPIDGQKRSVWATAEASTSIENHEQEEKASKEAGDIRTLVQKEMGDRKKLNVPLNATLFAETVEHYTVNEDKTERLTKMEIKKLDKPRFEKNVMVIEEKDGGLTIGMKEGLPQVIPKMDLVDIAGGKPEHLAIFLGIQATNRISLSRTWQSLGKRRYRDVRTFTVLIPEGRNAVIVDDMLFDFGSEAFLEKFSRSVDGVPTMEITP